MRFLPIITQIFLWYAVFDSIGSAEGSGATTIGGFGFREIVAYYLLTMVARAFSSMPGFTSGCPMAPRYIAFDSAIDSRTLSGKTSPVAL